MKYAFSTMELCFMQPFLMKSSFNDEQVMNESLPVENQSNILSESENLLQKNKRETSLKTNKNRNILIQSDMEPEASSNIQKNRGITTQL
jgi:hypothetical protein